MCLHVDPCFPYFLSMIVSFGHQRRVGILLGTGKTYINIFILDNESSMVNMSLPKFQDLCFAEYVRLATLFQFQHILHAKPIIPSHILHVLHPECQASCLGLGKPLASSLRPCGIPTLLIFQIVGCPKSGVGAQFYDLPFGKLI